jgi:type II secretory ATPase GspE/PulE/Tfp pilus assembly ATPase PilB-like protein
MRTTNGEALDMDMISSLMHCIIAQGLARRLCPHCCVVDDREETAQLLETLPEDKRSVMSPMRAGEGGCTQCYGTGYRGRILVYEILKFNRDLRQRIVEKQSLAQIAAVIPFEDRITGRLLQLIANGKTSLEEAYRLVEEF